MINNVKLEGNMPLADGEADYKCEFSFSKDECKDIVQTSFYKFTKVFIIFMILNVWCVLMDAISLDDMGENLGFSFIIAVLMIMIYIKMKNGVEARYNQTLVLYGEHSYEKKTVSFSNCIVMESNIRIPLTYSYDQVRNVYEGDEFYLLELPQLVFIPIKKDIQGKDVNNDFIKYIFAKCKNIKDKKLISIKAKRHLYIGLMIGSVVLSVILLITSLINSIAL